MTLRTLQENGKTFVLVPIADYERMSGNSEIQKDVAIFDAAILRNEESFPLAIFDAIDAGENAIAAFRKHRSIKQRALAKAAGISAAYLSQIESGARAGTLKALRAIASALNVPLDMISG